MEMQNITLSVPKNTLRKIKLVAAKRETSISKLMVEAMEKLAREDESYNKAMESALEMMNAGLVLGFEKPANRDEIHDRRY
jgi:hypothetical protein